MPISAANRLKTAAIGWHGLCVTHTSSPKHNYHHMITLLTSRALLFAFGAAITLLVPTAQAQTAAPAPEHTIAYNVSLSSQYIYRGLTQSNYRPAVALGADYSHSSGFYAGVWASSITWLRNFGISSARAEIDTYLGFKNTVNDFTYDVGYLRYNYPGSVATGFVKPDTDEIYIAGTFKEYTLKYSHGLSNVFGTADSKNTYYIDLTAAWSLAQSMTLTAHVGHQKFKGASADPATYTDWKLELGKDFGNGITGSVGYTGTNADKVFYQPPGKNFTGKNTGFLILKYTF
jgi:uncharacterized protein (TIGR02001 family)